VVDVDHGVAVGEVGGGGGAVRGGEVEDRLGCGQILQVSAGEVSGSEGEVL